jgi:hypothetical protein
MKHFLLTLILLTSVVAQQEKSSPLLLRVDEETFGPFRGAHSHSCIEIYENGKVMSFESWVPGVILVDPVTQKKSRPEVQQRSGHAELEEFDIDELKEFLGSSPVQRLAASYPPPYRPVDYFDNTRIDVFTNGKVVKTMELREYGAADLKKKSGYPAALIVLMDSIAENRSHLNYDQNNIKLSSPCEVVKKSEV